MYFPYEPSFPSVGWSIGRLFLLWSPLWTHQLRKELLEGAPVLGLLEPEGVEVEAEGRPVSLVVPP